MLELFVLSSLALCFQFPLFYCHPLVLGAGLLVVSVGMGGMLCYYGPLFGFCIFMVMVAGVLVVFCYTISLVPFKSLNYGEEEEKQSKMFKNWKGVKPVKTLPSKMGYESSEKDVDKSLKDFNFNQYIYAVLFGISSSALSLKKLVWEEMESLILMFSEIGYFSEDYSFFLVWMGVFLFIIMIFGAGVCSSYEGALIE